MNVNESTNTNKYENETGNDTMFTAEIEVEALEEQARTSFRNICFSAKCFMVGMDTAADTNAPISLLCPWGSWPGMHALSKGRSQQIEGRAGGVEEEKERGRVGFVF